MRIRPAITFTALTLTAGLLLTGCTTGHANPAPSTYPSHSTKVAGTAHSQLYIGYDTYNLYLIPATKTKAHDAIIDAAFAGTTFYKTYYIQVQDQHGHIAYSNKITTYQLLYLNQQVDHVSLTGDDGPPTDYKTLDGFVKALKTDTVADAKAKTYIQKEVQPYLSYLGGDTTPTTTPDSTTTAQQRQAKLQEDVNSEVTNTEVEITEGETVTQIQKTQTLTDGNTIVTKQDSSDDSNYTVTGTDTQTGYMYKYDSTTGQYTSNKK